MTLFIRRPSERLYACLDTSWPGQILWQYVAYDAELLRAMMPYFTASAQDFTNGSEFFEAESPDDLDLSDVALHPRLGVGYIDPSGNFYGVTTHSSFECFIKREQHDLMQNGWVKVGYISYSEQSNFWHMGFERGHSLKPSAPQKRTLEKIGLDPDDRTKRHIDGLYFEEVFGGANTRAMERLRQKSKAQADGKVRVLTIDEARVAYDNATAGLPQKPARQFNF